MGYRVDVAEDVIADHFAGALLGTAVGDALGAPFEGRRAVAPAAVAALVDDPGPLTYTDDTHMTIGVAQSLLERDGFDGAAMSATLAANYAAEPWRGYGAGPPRIFAAIQRGERWDEAAAGLFGGSGSYGNGAAMRVAPVALAAFPDLDATARLAAETARITHTHPEGIDGAVLQAVAVGYLLASEPQRQLDPEGMAATLRRYLQTAAFQSRLSQLLDLLAGGGDAGELGTGIEARNSVATALYCQLHQPDSFPAAVSAAISLGGDTDTITAMTGALAGARLGASAIPARWQQVEGAELLQELAAGFLARWRAGAA